MTDLGLVSILTPLSYVALAVLALGFTFCAMRSDLPSLYWKCHVLAWIVVVHGTPAILYGTLRYAWAWKHVGIIDFIQRTGTVDPSIHALDAYHNWPGFFALFAGIQTANDPIGLADLVRWAPLTFNVLFFIALVSLFGRLTTNDEHIAVASWFFFVSSWVGQDYFSPQALTYFLYLSLLSLIFGAFAIRNPGASPRHLSAKGSALLRRLTDRMSRWRSALHQRLSDPPSEHDFQAAIRWANVGSRDRWAVSVALVSIVTAVVVSHQLTPIAVALTVAGAVLLGYIRPRVLPVIVVAMMGLWALTGAAAFVASNAGELENVGSLSRNVSGTLTDLAVVSDGQVFVSWAARALVALVALLTLWAVARALRSGYSATIPALLAAAPVLFVVVSPYGNEVLFRVFLFALPGASFLIAAACLNSKSPLMRRLSVLTLSVGLIGLFLFAYFGREKGNHFTANEIATVAELMESAPRKSLLVEVSRNYPNQFTNYEKFFYVPIARESWDTRLRIAADPVAELKRWLSNPEYEATYVLVTRSQAIEAELYGVMPPGSVAYIESALREAEEFEVAYESPDAAVFTLAGGE